MELEELRRWSGAHTGLTSAEAANGLLLGLIESQLHPAVAKELLRKTSAAQLVTHG